MSINYANRGMGLENLIEYANEQYKAKGIALIQKVATPWKVIRKGSQIVSAFPEKKSTVDFIGAYKGRPIAFDAKSTQNKTRIPLQNFEHHQIDFMVDWEKQGGIAFFIIEFIHHGAFYLSLTDFVLASSEYGSSIPFKHFTSYAPDITPGNGIVLDYLSHLEAVG